MLFYNKKIFERCFHYRKKYWYENLKNIPLYFKLMHHLIKKGYDEYATWETFNWFIDTMKSILPHYKKHMGVPLVLEGYAWDDPSYDEEENVKKWYGIIDRMIELLDLMDERNEKYLAEEYSKYPLKGDTEREIAKNEFFELFSKYFYNLWD